MSHYKPYPDYKDSGVEWLGKVPEHWDIRSVKTLARLDGGAGFPDDEQGQSDNPIPFFKVAELANGLRYTANTVTEETAKRLGAKIFPPSTLVFAKVGAALLLNRRCLLEMPACLDNNMMALLPGAFDSQWLFWVFCTLDMGLIANPGAVPSINQEQVGNIRLGVPTIAEQKCIAQSLRRETARIDALIEKKTRFIELLNEKRQALITHAVTKGLDPNVNMKDSSVEWLGEVPGHWEVRSVSSVSTKITNGYVGPTRDILVEEGVRYLQSLHIKGNQIKFDFPYFVTEEWSNQHRKSILETGDVLIVQTGDIGQVTVVTDEFAGCNCHALIIVAPERSIIAGEWMSWVFNSSYGYHTLLSIQTGAMHPHLNCGNVKDVFLPVPPLTEQREIMKHIEHEERRVAALVGKTERSIELLKERRSALITAAVTGQIDLREAV